MDENRWEQAPGPDSRSGKNQAHHECREHSSTPLIEMGNREKERRKDNPRRNIAVEGGLKKCLDEAAIDKFFADCDRNQQDHCDARFADCSRKELLGEPGDYSPLIGWQRCNPAQTENLIQNEDNGKNDGNGNGTSGIG